MSQPSSCGSRPDQMGDEIKKLYTELAVNPQKDFGWGKGKENARALGYHPAWLNRVPNEVWESSAAVGNIFSLGAIGQGETVVDFGCGAGADLCVSAIMTGENGKLVGIEMTQAMAEKSRRNLALAGVRNFTILEADMTATTLPDGCADVVISNGSINLSPRKECVIKEIHRVLRAGGRFYLADIVREKGGEAKQCGESWANCVSGTLEPGHLVALMKKAGFDNAEMRSFTGYRTSATTIGALFYSVKK